MRGKPELFETLVGDLFRKMADGGFFGVDRIPQINGSLFDDASTIALTEEELALLSSAARLDWSAIDPSIFGTLFERGLDPEKRAQLGAHYTSREDIETLVDPVVMAPLRREWEETKSLVARLLSTGTKDSARGNTKPPTGKALQKAQQEAWIFIDRFLRRLESLRVLDPACGSGNFLYVTLRKLKDLESEVHDFAMDVGDTRPIRELGVGPWQLYGIEINQYAHELAQMTVWIGYLQWLRQHGTTTWKEPVLQAMSNIENKDAILDLTDPEHPREPTWPKVDFIVGNPPFLGNRMLRGELGEHYCEALYRMYQDRLGGKPDLCCYWFELARAAIEAGTAKRVGLIGTQGIRGGTNRIVLKRILDTGGIFWALSDHNWILAGANVHVSMIAFDGGDEKQLSVDGLAVIKVNSDLTSASDTTGANTLGDNAGLSFQGPIKRGPFDIDEVEALLLLRRPGNPNSRPNSDVVLPYLNAAAVARRGAPSWIVDFGEAVGESASAGYQGPFELVRERVLPARKRATQAEASERYWLHWRTRPEMRKALRTVNRFIVTPQVSKHRIFDWMSEPVHVDHTLIVFPKSDNYFFGVLHSRLHEIWSLEQGTQLEDRPRYTPTTCFETFPFPLPAGNVAEAIGAAAKELDELRKAWLNPREWVKEEVLEFPGSADGPWKRFVREPDARGIGTVRWPRIVARNAEAAKKLAKRTLTNLYNERPAWLNLAHKHLDEAVFAAYGWSSGLTDEQILEKLLALNLDRAAKQKL